MMKRAIVVGAGAVGLNTAYRLAEKRFGQVILIDKGPVGDGASSRAAGIVNHLVWNRVGVQVRRYGRELYKQLSEDLNGYQFRRSGVCNIFSATEKTAWPQRKELLQLYDELGAPYEILEPADMRARWPLLTPPDDTIGLLDPVGGYSEPHEMLPALAEACCRLGVDCREHVQLTDFLQSNGRICGVQTTMGPIEADVVITTCHVWTLVVLERLGIRLPMKNFVHQRFLTTPLPEPFVLPAIGAFAFNESYARPAFGNRLLVGVSTMQRREFPVRSAGFHMSTLAAPDQVLDQRRSELVPLLPLVKSATWEDQKIGLICYSADYEPIVGPLGRCPGLFVCAAFHSSGFALSPVLGQLTAEYVADGKPSIDISIYSPDRFESSATDKFLATTYSQRDMVSRRH